MPYQQVFTLAGQRRVHSSQIDWADKTFLNGTSIVEIGLVETHYLTVYPDAARTAASVGGEIAIPGADVFGAQDDAIYWIKSTSASGVGDVLAIDAGHYADNFADRATVLHIPSTADTAFLPGVPVIYTASGSFVKANYPGIRAVRVQVQGGGGAGGGAETTGGPSSALVSAGGGGGGGGYAEAVILVSDLDASEAVTVGAGGAGNAAAAGSDGGTSIFDTISGSVQGAGGSGGAFGTAQTTQFNVLGGSGGGASGGDINVGGQGGIKGVYASPSTPRAGGEGGSSHLGGGANINGGNANGNVGRPYGGGGSGACNGQGQGTNRSGGAGADGIVIVTPLY